MTRLLDQLTEHTRSLHEEIETEWEPVLRETTVPAYRRVLARWYGFVAPLERALADVPGVGRVVDVRRMRKHQLLAHDLHALGIKPPELQAIPQCLTIPAFEDVCEAIGWMYVVERSTLDHPNLFRKLANALPGDLAFASTYLKCYAGSVGEMWRSFGQSLEAAAIDDASADRILEASRGAYRHFRRWRSALDGKSPAVVESFQSRENT